MRVLRSTLPADRMSPGTFVVEEDGQVIAGPFVVYGKSDNKAAADHQNAERDDAKPYGDHPAGEYRVTRIVAVPESDAAKRHTYGSVFIAVEPVVDPSDGLSDAERRKLNGGSGIGLHAGTVGANGKLRPTHGCLRFYQADVNIVAGLIEVGTPYFCENK